MKDRKGFTLVELLAVIAILAILVIIALPNVIEMYNDAKENTFSAEVKTIFKAAQQSWLQDALGSDGEKIYSKCSDCLNPLALNGGANIQYYIKLNNAGEVTEYCATDGSYQYYYEGDSLNINNVNGIESVSSSDSSNTINITSDGCEQGILGRKITVCYFSSKNTEYAIGTINQKECYSKQSLAECFSGTNISPAYLYSTELSNPEPKAEFEECYANLGNDVFSCFRKAPNFQYCIRKANEKYPVYSEREPALAACTYYDAYYRKLLSTDPLYSQTQGCYSQVKYSICLDGDSEVEVYDKKKKKKLKKKLKDVTYDDLILCWDFVKGEFTYAKPLWIMKPEQADSYIVLKFSDGSKLKVMGDHRIYNVDAQMFTSCKSDEASPIGMRTINSKGEIITLVERKVYIEPAVAYNVIIDKHINLYTNGLLTSRGLNNLYPIENMKFVKCDREVFTREELREIPDEYFYGLNLGETPKTFMGSEERTKAQLLLFIERTINTKKE